MLASVTSIQHVCFEFAIRSVVELDKALVAIGEHVHIATIDVQPHGKHAQFALFELTFDERIMLEIL